MKNIYKASLLLLCLLFVVSAHATMSKQIRVELTNGTTATKENSDYPKVKVKKYYGMNPTGKFQEKLVPGASSYGGAVIPPIGPDTFGFKLQIKAKQEGDYKDLCKVTLNANNSSKNKMEPYSDSQGRFCCDLGKPGAGTSPPPTPSKPTKSVKYVDYHVTVKEGACGGS